MKPNTQIAEKTKRFLPTPLGEIIDELKDYRTQGIIRKSFCIIMMILMFPVIIMYLLTCGKKAFKEMYWDIDSLTRV